MLARLIATVAHEIITEYRRLNVAFTPPAQDQAAPSPQQYDITGTTAATAERAGTWDLDQRPPVAAARFGFGLPEQDRRG